MPDNGRKPETIALTIDGREVVAPKGATLLQAAAGAGIEVPHYCYHPGLSAPAQCRVCLVEVEGAPKLQPACVTQAQDGQVVRTDGDEAVKMRKGVFEFYLVNHPLDCPICDMSGECKLQDYVFAEGRDHGRAHEPKRVFGRDDFGGDVLYYGDRCVMCTRCVRFMEEVAGDARLTVVERGNRAVIDTFFDEGLEGAAFAGNVVDICPVGALVSKEFLHKARAWDLDHTPSVCAGCSQGCNIELHTRDNLVQRIKPRENQEVNGHWMCDYGRESYEWLNRPGRLAEPLVGRVRERGRATPERGEATPERGQGAPERGRVTDERGQAEWPDALDQLRARAEELRGADVRVVASPLWPNEGLAALDALARAAGTVKQRVFRSPRAQDEEPLPGFPLLIRRRDLAPNVDGAGLLGFERAGDDQGEGGLEAAADHDGVLLVLGDELRDQPEGFGARAALFVYLGTHDSPAAANADFVLPVTTFAEQEGTFVNAQGRVQCFQQALRPPAGARPAWLVLGALAAALDGGRPHARADAAFASLAAAHPAFTGLEYDALGLAGAPLAAPAAAPAGAAAS